MKLETISIKVEFFRQYESRTANQDREIQYEKDRLSYAVVTRYCKSDVFEVFIDSVRLNVDTTKECFTEEHSETMKQDNLPGLVNIPIKLNKVHDKFPSSKTVRTFSSQYLHTGGETVAMTV